MRCGRRAWGLVALLAVSGGCGKKGPPLPPLVRVPAAPGDLKAERRGDTVDVQFTVPAANADGSRPANIQRVDVFALDAAGASAEADVLKAGVRVATVDVKAPRNPNATIDADDPDSDMEPPEGPGLDQGAVTHLRDRLAAAGGPAEAATRTYVIVGITTRGRRGPASKPASVPLGAAPPAVPQPTLTYDETAVTIAWDAVAPDAPDQAAAYHVYDVSSPAPSAAATPGAGGSRPAAAGVPGPAAPVDGRLTTAPVNERTFVDKRIAWNVERCYTVRAVRRIGTLSVEGDAAPVRCVTLVDSFPPAAPTGVTAVASEGAINLIWTASPERDLAGYRVWRAASPSTDLEPLTAAAITETTFTDTVQPGVRYTYAVQAVDTAGNLSALSTRIEETAR